MALPTLHAIHHSATSLDHHHHHFHPLQHLQAKAHQHLPLGSSAHSIDPDQDRPAPAQPTTVYFPQNDVCLSQSDEWAKRPPNLFNLYSEIRKPSDVRPEHLEALNIATINDVELEDLIPATHGDVYYLPPKSWTQNLDPAARRSSLQIPVDGPGSKRQVLSNGARAPEADVFIKHVRDLSFDTEDGLRSIARRKPRPGHSTVSFHQHREFWARLEMMSQFWDTSLDDYHEGSASTATSPTASPNKAFRRLSSFLTDKNAANGNVNKPNGASSENSKKRYKGWRKTCGSKMPDTYRSDCVRSLVRNVTYSFNCRMDIPRKAAHLEVKNLLLPVAQSAVVWRNPENKDSVKRGIHEGPLLNIQCRSETGFVKDKDTAALDLAREIAGLILVAQERAREGRQAKRPGEDKWYTTNRRWGGGPGGEFGEAEGNTDADPNGPSRRMSLPGGGYGLRKPTEEEIWKELKPNNSLWDPNTTYVSIGKDRRFPQDTVSVLNFNHPSQFPSCICQKKLPLVDVSFLIARRHELTSHSQVFMISSLFHHVSILKFEVHPAYLEFMETGKRPKPDSNDEDTAWYRPKLYRSRWFDLFKPADRIEAFRGIWGVHAYLMRLDGSGQPIAAEKAADRPTNTTTRSKSSDPIKLGRKSSERKAGRKSEEVASRKSLDGAVASASAEENKERKKSLSPVAALGHFRKKSGPQTMTPLTPQRSRSVAF